MSLVGPWLSTTSTKKRKEKITKSKQEELEREWRERNQRLKQMGLPKETYEQFLEWVYGRGKKTKTKTQDWSECKKAGAGQNTIVSSVISKTHVSEFTDIKTQEASVSSKMAISKWTTGPVSSKPSPTYTGKNIIGIVVMHKSCLQPVFSQEEAIDAARMRR